LTFARDFGGREFADEKWEALLRYEAQVMAHLGKEESIHG